ncbi:MAG: helix-turn-helix domain-containing protein [Clostridia bacterium]|nr:helix-turn-helix domain-containing protein [Clostridia bacterium]
MGLRRDEQTDELFRSILSLQNLDECYGYFEDLCTNKEVKDMSQRLTIAKLLEEGYSYLQAAEKLGVSSATIGRVKRCLDYGDGGYRMILGRLKAEKNDE